MFALWVLCGVTLLELEGFRFRRSEAAVDVARFLASREGVRNVAMEDGTTTTGATLYLRPPIRVVDIDMRRLDAAYFWGMLVRPDAQYVVLRESSLRPLYLDLLRQAGYINVIAPEGDKERYGIFARQIE